MRSQRFGIFILLVNHDGIRVIFNLVRNIAYAAGFLARSLGELAQGFGDLSAFCLRF
jgi:hypothetical protein